MDASERDVLREYGYTNGQIDFMSPAQRSAEYQDATDAGVESTIRIPSVQATEKKTGHGWLGRVGAGLTGAIFLASVIAFNISIDEEAPKDVDVVVDLATSTYASIPCVIDGDTNRPLLTQTATLSTDPLPLVEGALIAGLGVTRTAGFKADPKCKAADGFTNRRRLTSMVLGIGHRWTEDGRWRW